MKFLVAFTSRSGGSSAEVEAAATRLLDLYSKWSPPADSTIHQFVARLDGRGGYLVVESDDTHSVAEGPLKFSPFFDYEIVPVADITDAVAWFAEGIQFRQ